MLSKYYCLQDTSLINNYICTYDKHVNNEGGNVALRIQLNDASEVALVGGTFNGLNNETRHDNDGTLI